MKFFDISNKSACHSSIFFKSQKADCLSFGGLTIALTGGILTVEDVIAELSALTFHLLAPEVLVVVLPSNDFKAGTFGKTFFSGDDARFPTN